MGENLEFQARNPHIEDMEIFAILFAVVMLAAFGTVTALTYWLAGFWAAAILFALMVLLYRAATYTSGPAAMHDDTLNAFQQPLTSDRD